jgi:23S rRNA (adenine2503-C2)-methyltransferase
VTTLVFMGMGEPLANYANLVAALRILTTPSSGSATRRERVTVSTWGLVPGIDRLGREDLKVNLAISLHAASDEVRARLMPVNRAFDIEALMAAVKRYPLTTRQRVFFEYVMLDGVNDSPRRPSGWPSSCAGEEQGEPDPLQRLGGLELSPAAAAAHPGLSGDPARRRITTTVRWSKGEDIGAACGPAEGAGGRMTRRPPSRTPRWAAA